MAYRAKNIIIWQPILHLETVIEKVLSVDAVRFVILEPSNGSNETTILDVSWM
jgi:hypothetical protein